MKGQNRSPQVGRRGRGRWVTPPVARNRAMRRAEAAKGRRLPARIDQLKSAIKSLVESPERDSEWPPRGVRLRNFRHWLKILTTRRAQS